MKFKIPQSLEVIIISIKIIVGNQKKDLEEGIKSINIIKKISTKNSMFNNPYTRLNSLWMILIKIWKMRTKKSTMVIIWIRDLKCITIRMLEAILTNFNSPYQHHNHSNYSQLLLSTITSTMTLVVQLQVVMEDNSRCTVIWVWVEVEEETLQMA